MPMYFVMDELKFIEYGGFGNRSLVSQHETLEEAELAFQEYNKKNSMHRVVKDPEKVPGGWMLQKEYHDGRGFYDLKRYVAPKPIGTGAEWRNVRYFVTAKNRKLSYMLSSRDPVGPPPTKGRWYTDTFLCYDGEITAIQPGYMQRDVDVVGPVLDARSAPKLELVVEESPGSGLLWCTTKGKLATSYIDASGSTASISGLPESLDDEEGQEEAYGIAVKCAFPKQREYIIHTLMKRGYLKPASAAQILAKLKEYGRLEKV